MALTMRARDTALIRKLCSLGLPPQTLVQSLLPALRQLIPAHSGGVFWVSHDAQMTGLYAERLLPPEAMAAYYERHYRGRLEGFATVFRKRAQSPDPVSTHSFSAAEQGTEYFRDVLRPLDVFHALYAVLRHGESPFAQLSLYRSASDPPFDHADEAALRGLVRYLSAGLHDPVRSGIPVDASVVVEETLGLVTRSGAVVSGSDDWRRLVRLAALSHVSPSEASREHAVIEEFVRGLVTAGRPEVRNGSVELVRHTAWGRFTLRVFPLDGDGATSGQAGVLIRREEPRILALVRGAGNSSLSPQQREVALLLADGRTNPDIARTLGLSLNTASYHVKQVYAKLDVNDRNDIEALLLQLAHAASAPEAFGRPSPGR